MGGVTVNERHIKQALQTIAQQAVSDSVDLWPMIQSHVETPRRPRPVLQLGRLAAALLILLMAGAAVYAVDRLLQTGDPGLDALQQANQITELGQTMTQDGITITLDYAYADANRISIVYSGMAQLPPTEQISVSEIRLSDDRGRSFLPMFGGGGGGGGEGTAEETPEAFVYTFSGTLSYDASIIDDTSEQLSLNLELDTQRYIGQPATGGAMPEPGAMTGFITGPDGSPVPLVFIPSGAPLTFTFAFDVPFNPGRVMDTPQTVTAGGLDITLQKLVTTPSMTRVELCFAAPAEGTWLPETSIAVNGEDALPPTTLDLTQRTTDTACSTYLIPQAPLLDTPAADWTLTITRLRLPGSEDQTLLNTELEKQGIQRVSQPNGSFGLTLPEGMAYDEFLRLVDQITIQFQEKIEGPWIFQFTLP